MQPCPPGSEDNAWIIPAATAARTRTTFAISDRSGQVSPKPRPGAGMVTTRTFADGHEARSCVSSVAEGALGSPDASSGGCSFDSELNEPGGSSSSGCCGRGSGKRSSA
eukprot:6182588-Pleurochrysis_carterae.AAC.1